MHLTSPVPVLLALAGALAAADGMNLQVHGFVSQGYLYSTGNDYLDNTSEGSPQFTEVGFNLTATPIERVTLGLAISAQDLGRYFNFKPQIDWAYGRYELPKLAPWLDANVAVGRVKMGFGLYSDTVDLDMTRTTVFLPQAVYSPVFRDLFLAGNGAQANLTADAGRLGSFELSVFVGSSNIDEDNVAIRENWIDTMRAIPGLWANAILDIDELSIKSTETVSLTWNTPVDGLRLKGSMTHAADVYGSGTGVVNDNGVFAGAGFRFENLLHNYVGIIAGAEWQVGDWTIAGEYMRQYVKFENTLEVFGAFVSKSVAYANSDAGYLQAAYRFHPAWEGSLGVSVANTDDEDRSTDDSANWHRGASAALRWDVTDHFLLKGEFQRNRGGYLLAAADNPDGEEKYWNLMAVKATFDF